MLLPDRESPLRMWFTEAHDLIAENGTILAESRRFENGAVYGIMDIHKLNNERRRMTTCGFASDREREGFREALFYLEKIETKLEQKFDSQTFCAFF